MCLEFINSFIFIVLDNIKNMVYWMQNVEAGKSWLKEK